VAAASRHRTTPDHPRSCAIGAPRLTEGAPGFRSIFAPVTAALLDHLGWRHTYLVLAVVLAAVTCPRT
jgi:hypothetical protein